MTHRNITLNGAGWLLASDAERAVLRRQLDAERALIDELADARMRGDTVAISRAWTALRRIQD